MTAGRSAWAGAKKLVDPKADGPWKAMGYKAKADDAAKSCKDCKWFTAGADGKSGDCKLITTALVHTSGTCNNFLKK